MNKKELTGYPSIDNPQSINASYFEKNPIIPSVDIVTMLKLLSMKNRNSNAINCDDLTATYQELINDAKNLALAYKELGVRKGDIVTLSLPNNYQAIVSFFALNYIGAITTFIDVYSSKKEIITYLNEYESPIYINFNVSKEFNEEIKKNTSVKHIITLCKDKINDKKIDNNYVHNNSDEFIDFHTLGSLSKYQNGKIFLPNKGNDDCVIVYTSGSTGKPKSVVLTNKNVLSAQIYLKNSSMDVPIVGTKTFSCVPLRYAYGLLTSNISSLLWNKELIMSPSWSKDKIEYYLSKNPNILFFTPAAFEMMKRYLPADFDLSSQNHIYSGGDFLYDDQISDLNDFYSKHNNNHVVISNGSGLTEFSGTGGNAAGIVVKKNTAGKIPVGTTAIIIDKDIPDDKPIENSELLEEKKYHEIGEICYSGDCVFKEYFGEPYKTQCAKFVKNGKEFVRSGGIGSIDEEGYVTIAGRKSRYYIPDVNYKVYMDTVQKVISQCDESIANAAVVEVPDSEKLYTGTVFIVLKDGVEPSDELKEIINEKMRMPINNSDGQIVQLKEYEIPTRIEFVNELPKIYGSEKTDYEELKRMANDKNKNLILRK